jgi:hypothetical protein
MRESTADFAQHAWAERAEILADRPLVWRLRAASAAGKKRRGRFVDKPGERRL